MTMNIKAALFLSVLIYGNFDNVRAASTCIKVDRHAEPKITDYLSLGDSVDLVKQKLFRSRGCIEQPGYIDCEYRDAKGVRYLVEGSEIQRIEIWGKDLISFSLSPYQINGRDDANAVLSKIQTAKMTWSVSFNDHDEMIFQPEKCFLNSKGVDSYLYIVFDKNNTIKRVGMRQDW